MRQALIRRVVRRVVTSPRLSGTLPEREAIKKKESAPYDPGIDAVMAVSVFLRRVPKRRAHGPPTAWVWSLHLDDQVNRTVTNGNNVVSARVLMGVVMLAHTAAYIFNQVSWFPCIFVESIMELGLL